MPDTQTTRIIMTAQGASTPGVLSQFLEVIYHCGGNIIAAKIDQLAGIGYGILMIEIENKRIRELDQALDATLPTEMVYSINASNQSNGIATPKGHTLQLSGANRPGAAVDATRQLAKYGVNIEQLDARSLSTDDAHGIFQITALITLKKNSAEVDLFDLVEQINQGSELEAKILTYK